MGVKYLHCSMASIGNAALLRHTVTRRDALRRGVTDVLGGAWLLGVW